MKYRKKPIVIEAVQWTGENGKEIAEFMLENEIGLTGPDLQHLSIKTLEGRMTADPGDWIIKGIKGEFYPIKPDIFDTSYELVEDEDKELALLYKYLEI